MKVAVFDSHRFERESLAAENQKHGHELVFFETRLTPESAPLARGFDAVCAFANDKLTSQTIHLIKEGGTRVIALRCAGFNHVDLAATEAAGIPVLRVPAYSPHAVAEHAVGLILSLNRHIPRASSRVRELNFSLDGLVGFDLHGRTVGVIGMGKIGRVFARIMLGFGCKVLAYDPNPEKQVEGVVAVTLDELYTQSDIVSLHCPLRPETRHLIDSRAFAKMKKGVMIINTGRGGLIDTHALIQNLKSGQIGWAGLDVYEEEEGVFFEDLSERGLQDDQLARLLTFPNVLITAHQAFLTRDALANIAQTTLANLSDFQAGRPLLNRVKPSVT